MSGGPGEGGGALRGLGLAVCGALALVAGCDDTLRDPGNRPSDELRLTVTAVRRRAEVDELATIRLVVSGLAGAGCIRLAADQQTVSPSFVFSASGGGADAGATSSRATYDATGSGDVLAFVRASAPVRTLIVAELTEEACSAVATVVGARAVAQIQLEFTPSTPATVELDAAPGGD